MFPWLESAALSGLNVVWSAHMGPMQAACDGRTLFVGTVLWDRMRTADTAELARLLRTVPCIRLPSLSGSRGHAFWETLEPVVVVEPAADLSEFQRLLG